MAPSKAKKAAKPKAPKPKKSDPKADKAAKVKSATKGTKPVKALPAPIEDVRKLPGAKAVQNLSKKFAEASDAASTLAGDAGKLISAAVQAIHLNAPQFRDAHRLKMMGMKNPSKLRLALSDRDYYRKCLELDKLAGEGLFDAGEGRPVMEDEEGEETAAEEQEGNAEGEPDEAPEEREDADNVHRLGRGQAA